MLRTPDPARVITPLDEIAGNLHQCEDLSAMMMFVADMAGREKGATPLVSDVAASAPIWRGVAAVLHRLRERLALVQAAEELHDVTILLTPGAA
jgi:hypothetical protein